VINNSLILPSASSQSVIASLPSCDTTDSEQKVTACNKRVISKKLVTAFAATLTIFRQLIIPTRYKICSIEGQRAKNNTQPHNSVQMPFHGGWPTGTTLWLKQRDSFPVV
jgi:hypothetical protein